MSAKKLICILLCVFMAAIFFGCGADSQATATTCFGIYYTGADENDKPNLLPLLSDWKAEFDWDSYYYNASFELEQ